jgi:hypothetical protein
MNGAKAVQPAPPAADNYQKREYVRQCLNERSGRDQG